MKRGERDALNMDSPHTFFRAGLSRVFVSRTIDRVFHVVSPPNKIPPPQPHLASLSPRKPLSPLSPKGKSEKPCRKPPDSLPTGACCQLSLQDVVSVCGMVKDKHGLTPGRSFSEPKHPGAYTDRTAASHRIYRVRRLHNPRHLRAPFTILSIEDIR